tara:strand:- start:38 stop:223 length:186 start_codon:yes stop_codon:yes gene_type:complete
MPYTIRLKQGKTNAWAAIRHYDNLTDAEKEYARLNKADKKGMIRIMALFHGRKKIKQNFYD